MNFNSQDDLDTLAEERLGAYVYALRDPGPENTEVFYVGKAGGKEAKGNQRVLDHFVEARECLKNPNRPASDKIKRILQIWERGREVEWFIIRRNLRDQDEALHVEGAIIDILNLSPVQSLLNIQSGNKFLEHGYLSKEGVKLLNAQNFGNSLIPKAYFDKEWILIFFNISNVYSNQLPPYEATRRSWKIHEIIRSSPRVIGVGLVNGISRGAWQIQCWNVEKDSKLWYFTQQEEIVSLKYINFGNIVRSEKLSSHWKWGNPVAIGLTKNREYRIIRGARDKEATYPLK